jgi:hypothetical protein
VIWLLSDLNASFLCREWREIILKGQSSQSILFRGASPSELYRSSSRGNDSWPLRSRRENHQGQESGEVFFTKNYGVHTSITCRKWIIRQILIVQSNTIKTIIQV